MEATASVTTTQMWQATLVAATLAAAFGLIADRRVREPFPAHLPTALAVVGVVYFTGLYSWAAWTFWDSCYAAVLPPWGRAAAPLVGAVWGGMGLAFWWVARRLSPQRPVPPFLVLGGLQSLPGHLIAIHGRGLLEGCPILRGITPSSALTFGLFEFGVYWAVVLLVAHLSAGSRKA